MIEALSLSVAAIAVAALLLVAAQRRRFATLLARLVDDAERLAEGGRGAGRRVAGAGGSETGAAGTDRRGAGWEAELSRLSRALDRLAVRAAQDVAAVETERRTLDEILEGVPEGVLVTTPDRVPIYANRAFRALFEVDPAASTAELLALVRRPQVHQALGRATAGEVGPAIEISLGGREVSVVARRLQGPTGILLMARDVTETNRLTRMRRDFVTNLSHEIKTPLAVIRGAAETLQEAGPDDADAAERFVRRIIEQIYRLEDLLKDLLTLARLESPEASLHRQPVDLDSICRRAAEVLAPLAAREEVTLRTELEPAPPLRGDAKALERMVVNLLVNGIQYNRRGGVVTLRVRGGQLGGDPDPADAGSVAPRVVIDGIAPSQSVVLEVEDDGIGIAEAELPRIFERFYRVDKGRGRAEGGSGLGLAIVKHVAQHHGGTVEVRSVVDRGSLFRVVLPVTDAASREATRPAAEAAFGEGGHGSRPYVAPARRTIVG